MEIVTLIDIIASQQCQFTHYLHDWVSIDATIYIYILGNNVFLPTTNGYSTQKLTLSLPEEAII